MKAMIFAAGLGTRLRPLTDTRPKALVEVAGRPLLEIVASRLVAQGCDSLVVNAHHFAWQIIRHIAANGREPDIYCGVPTTVSDESDRLLDTGGGILYARPLLEGTGRFLVHNVDILSNLDIRSLVDTVRPDALATLVVSGRQTFRYLLFDGDMRLVGWTDVRTGQIKSPWPELVRPAGSDPVIPDGLKALAFAGIHLISDRVFDEMASLHAPGEPFPIMDFYLSVCDRCPIYGYEPQGLQLIDVGKPETLAVAETFIKELR